VNIVVGFEDVRKQKVFETMLIYGPSKSGKTWFYCDMINTILEQDAQTVADATAAGKAVQSSKPKFYILNTDNGFARTFEGYFRAMGKDPPWEQVLSAYTPDPTIARMMVEQASKIAKPNDWVIMDLISDYYSMAKDVFFEESAKAAGVTLDQYIQKIAKTKVGGLDPSSWALVQRMNNAVAYDPIANPYCNVLGVATEKPIHVSEQYASRQTDAEAKDRKMEYLSMFEEAGALPGGHNELAYKFSTILRMTGSTSDNRQFRLVSDRGYAIDDAESHRYEKRSYLEFCKVRETLRFGKAKTA